MDTRRNTRNSKGARPSVRNRQVQINNIVTPESKRRQAQNKRRAEAVRDRQAKVLGLSLSKRNEKDFVLKKSLLGSIGSNTKRVISIAFIGLVVLAIGIAIGVYVFMATTSARLSIDDDVKSKLIRAQDNQEFYMLMACDVDNDEKESPDLIVLTRVDPVNMSIILVSIPSSTYVASSSGGGTTLKDVYENSTDAGLIESVASFSEVGISYYVKMNSNGLSQLVDALGGIDVDLKEYVDDSNAGDAYIGQGQSTINGYETITLLKAQNFKEGMQTISDNQRKVCKGLLSASLFKNLNIAMITDSLAGNIKTNMSVKDIIDFVDKYSKVNPEKILDTDVPGYKSVRNNNMVFMIDANEWKNLRQQFSYGLLPTKEDDTTYKDINPSSFTVFIQNGAGIDGAASMLSEKLSSFGFNVIGSQNADTNLYKETLIIYNDEKLRESAFAIKNSINNGRVINGNGLYNMNSDILIIIGADLKI